MPLARVRGPGHPDVLCDVIATMIVDEYLRRDPETRLQIQVAGGHESLFVSGEVASQADFDVHPVVARALAAIGVTEEIETFAQFATAAPAWFPAASVREPVSIMGYATSETEDAQPIAYYQATKIAQAIEQERTKNPDWFWQGADYEVVTEDRTKRAWIQVEHIVTEPIERIRERIQALLAPIATGWTCEVNVGGASSLAGIAHRSGVSGRVGTRLVSSHLPTLLSGVGQSLRQPANLGAWLLRREAKRLVKTGHGKAVLLHATWLALETKPSIISARNEKGEDLTEFLEETFDLAAPHETMTAPGWLLAALRAPFDASKTLPWEE